MKKITFAISLGLSALFAQEGEQVYSTYCIACHGATGQGLKPAFPPLANSEWVQGDSGRSIRILLHGLMGAVEVGGDTYNGMMPAQGLVLNDAQIAGVLNHVRSNWGNEGQEEITEAQVKAVRDEYAGRVAPWNPAELLEMYPLGGAKEVEVSDEAGVTKEGKLINVSLKGEMGFKFDTKNLAPSVFFDAGKATLATPVTSAGYPGAKKTEFLGYDFQEEQNSITFEYKVNGLTLQDKFQGVQGKINRTITPTVHWPVNASLVVASGSSLKNNGYRYSLGKDLHVNSYYLLSKEGGKGFTYPLVKGQPVYLNYIKGALK